MIIEDVELRDIFKTASEEHLQKLEDGLLHLEKHPHDQAMLEEVLREAHTLKGDSRMLGVDTVETLIHQLEDSLGAVKRGEVIFLHSCAIACIKQSMPCVNWLVRQSQGNQQAWMCSRYWLN